MLIKLLFLVKKDFFFIINLLINKYIYTLKIERVYYKIIYYIIFILKIFFIFNPKICKIIG